LTIVRKKLKGERYLAHSVEVESTVRPKMHRYNYLAKINRHRAMVTTKRE